MAKKKTPKDSERKMICQTNGTIQGKHHRFSPASGSLTALKCRAEGSVTHACSRRPLGNGSNVKAAALLVHTGSENESMGIWI